MNFEWDAQKASVNVRKHGVRFEDAAHVFLDSSRIESFDNADTNGEDCWITIGMVEPALLLVAYTVRGDDGEIIRIISARKADAHERKKYREIQA